MNGKGDTLTCPERFVFKIYPYSSIMKKLIFLSLIVGLLFAGQPFPPNYGTDTVLIDSLGDLSDGSATYENSDGSISTTIGAASLPCLEFEEEWGIYYEEWMETEIEGFIVYYYCAEAYGGESTFIHCALEFCKDDIFYSSESYIIGGTVGEAEGEILATAYMLVDPEEFYGIGNNGDDDQNGDDGNGNQDGGNGGNGEGEKELCPLSIFLIGISTISFYYSK